MDPFRYSSLKPLGADEIRIFGFEEGEDSIRIQHIRRPSDISTTSEGNAQAHTLFVTQAPT
jgi:hypothetical protein